MKSMPRTWLSYFMRRTSAGLAASLFVLGCSGLPSLAFAADKAPAMIVPGQFEVLRLDNDPNFPENGKIDFVMETGV